MRVLLVSLALAGTTMAATPAHADSLDELARAADARPDDKQACDAYATAALKQKRFDDAIRRLKVTVARIPDYAEGYYKLAYAYRQKRAWADAADYYRRYQALDPARTDTYFGLGAALEGLGDNQGAATAYRKYIGLEKAPGKQRFVDEAMAELEKLQNNSAAPGTPAPAATTTPASADASALAAEADGLRAQSRWADATVAYQRAIAADRSNLALYNNLGNCWFALGRYDEAARAFGDATRIDPGYALGWYNLAHALRKAEHNRESADAYQRYVTLMPDDPDPYYGLGQVLKALGDVPGAVAAFKKYVAMEKRPDEQKWVDKARTELQALEALPQAKPATTAKPAGKLEQSDVEGEMSAREKLDRELKRDAVLPPTDDDLRLMDPFANGRELTDPFVGAVQMPHDLKDPFRTWDGDSIVDPFTQPAVNTGGPSVERLRQYGAALAAYRRALARHAEDVSLRFERGFASAMAGGGGNAASSALRAWNSVPLEDGELAAARAAVERIRKSLGGEAR